MDKAYNFLKQLRQNNNREWFIQHKGEYQEALEEFTMLVEWLIEQVKIIEPRIGDIKAKDCIYRIYRDARFCKDKPPYKENFGAFIAPGGRKSDYAGYYIHFQPGGAFAGGGLWHPRKEILDAVRTRIYNNPTDFLKIIKNDTFKQSFGQIQGRKLKKAPQGFDKNFPYLDLIKFKDYTVSKPIEERLLRSQALKLKIAETFQAIAEFNEFLNQAIDELKG